MTTKPLTYAELGAVVLAAIGADACLTAYGSTDPNTVGHVAAGYGDVDRDGTLT